MDDIASQQDEDVDVDPLRHLMDSANIVPPQRHSIHNETIELSFTSSFGPSVPPLFINLAVDAGPGCGGVTWPAGEVLSRYLARRGSACLTGKNVLELGSGTGLVGLVAGLLGGRVWITDQLPLLDIMRQNIHMNSLSASVTALELNWGEPLSIGVPRLDLVLAADCVYYEPAFPLLVETLAALAVDDDMEVLFCYKKRRKADKRFFHLLKKEFNWTEVSDDPDHAVYSREAISLLKLTRKAYIHINPNDEARAP